MISGIIKHKLIDLYRGTGVVKDFKDIAIETRQGCDYLKKLQKDKLTILLLHSREHVRFYKEKLGGLSVDEIKNQPYDVLKTLPYITKEDFLSKNEDFISGVPFKSVENNTGGSTGAPLTYMVDVACVSRTRAFDLYWWSQAFGYKFGDRVLTIGGSSIGGSKNLQMKVYNYLQSKIFLEGGNISNELLEKNVSLICRGNYDVIYAYPSALMLFVEKANAWNMKFRGRIKGIATTSENLTPNVCSALEHFFNAPVYDVYGARDGGIVADECNQKMGLHYNFQDCFVEELNVSNQLMLPELVLTNLVSYSQPMIRYRVGDLGRISNDPCNCGNPLPRIVDFSGRTRDILSLSNGKIIHGSLFNKVVSYFPKVKQYQVIYNQNNLKFNMLVSPEFSNEEEKEFKFKIKELTELEDITIDFSGIFEYTEAGKLKTVLTK